MQVVHTSSSRWLALLLCGATLPFVGAAPLSHTHQSQKHHHHHASDETPHLNAVHHAHLTGHEEASQSSSHDGQPAPRDPESVHFSGLHARCSAVDHPTPNVTAAVLSPPATTNVCAWNYIAESVFYYPADSRSGPARLRAPPA